MEKSLNLERNSNEKENSTNGAALVNRVQSKFIP